MESFNVDEFIRKVKVEKEYDSDTCEYEVTKMAMEFYLKYPCYKEWGIFLHGDSIGNYMRDKEQKRDKEDYRGNGSYIGAHLLKETEGNKILKEHFKDHLGATHPHTNKRTGIFYHHKQQR